MEKHFIVLPANDENFNRDFITSLMRKRYTSKESAQESANAYAKQHGTNQFFVYELATGTKVKLVVEEAK